jgi:hypothetical protein
MDAHTLLLPKRGHRLMNKGKIQYFVLRNFQSACAQRLRVVT